MIDRIIQQVALESGLPVNKVRNTVGLLDDQKTIPFIARYRKEVTGELDEIQIRKIDELLKFHRSLEEKKENIIRLIDEQGKLTTELKAKILQAHRPTELEDLYRPFRPKRKTRASIARERGLKPLADYLLSCPPGGQPEKEGSKYLSQDINTPADALQGARDIIAEQVADDPEVRQKIREKTYRMGILRSQARDSEADSVYTMYYDYQEALSRIPPHRILAINRGEKDDILKVFIELDSQPVLDYLVRRFCHNGPAQHHLQMAIEDGYNRLLAPAVERDIRNDLTEKAHQQALQVFSKNLRALLLQRPVPGKTWLGIDPGYRTGCKWAVVDPTGRMLEVGVFFPTPPRQDIKGTLATLNRLVDQYHINAIAIGNGTGSRETEQVVASFIKESDLTALTYTMVSEAGASVYSASELAAQEFSQLDVAERSAISIARRVQDPMAELVKIEPRSCGVGQYQHDIAPRRLDENLTAVVESAVNYVGVDLNTASPSLLAYVAGLNNTVAKNIVKHREANGPFRTRRELLKVPRLGPRSFEQAAGFLRIPYGDNPLDNTPIHPESYKLTMHLLAYLEEDLASIGSEKLHHKLKALDIIKAAKDLEAGIPTLRDIVEALMRPGRDPREDVPPPVFRQDVLSIEDLNPGMEFTGVVRNVVDFGAFIDIGVKTDGLVHISEMAPHRVNHPLDIVSIGDIIKVRVLSVDINRKRISLSMKDG